MYDKMDGVNVYDRNGFTPLAKAVFEGDFFSVHVLLANGADPNKGNPRTGGSNPLIVAALRGYLEVVQVLLDAGADPNIRGLEGSTALIWAICSDHTDVAQLLLNHGADPNYCSPIRNNVPLVVAASRGKLELVRSLLAKGADPNKSGMDHYTAIQHARVGGFPNIVELLLDHGAEN